MSLGKTLYGHSLVLVSRHNDWLLADTCPQAANHSNQSENELKFYNPEAWFDPGNRFVYLVKTQINRKQSWFEPH